MPLPHVFLDDAFRDNGYLRHDAERMTKIASIGHFRSPTSPWHNHRTLTITPLPLDKRGISPYTWDKL